MRGRTDSSSSSSAVTQPLKALDAASIMASVTCLAPTPMHPNATPASSLTQTHRGTTIPLGKCCKCVTTGPIAAVCLRANKACSSLVAKGMLI